MSHEWLENSVAYALDALDAGERERFERHLEGCAECRAELERVRETASMLAYAAPPAEPPAGLRDRVLREALGDRATSAVSAHEPPRPGGLGSRPAWWVAAAALVVMAVALWGWSGERRARGAVERMLAEAGVQNEEIGRQLAERQSLLDAMLGPDVVTASLAASGDLPAARVFWNRGQGVAVVMAFNVPTAPRGRTYQLWGIDSAAGTAPVSLGTFDTDAAATALLQVTVPQGVTFDLAAMTEEPAGGSPQPTTQPFLVGAFGAD